MSDVQRNSSHCSWHLLTLYADRVLVTVLFGAIFFAAVLFGPYWFARNIAPEFRSLWKEKT
jgi:hypothetical protein